MAVRTQTLTPTDIRSIFHLLGEILELGRDPLRWRKHLLERMMLLLDARLGMSGEHFISPTAPKFVGLVEIGWLPHEQEVFYEHLNSGGMARDPMHEPVQRLLHRSFTRLRSDLVGDDAWYSSSVMPIRRKCNIDDQIYSRWKLPHSGWAHVISIFRAFGAKPFTARDRLMISLLHRELGRLWWRVDHGPMATLPPRLRQTLDLIFSGYSEKQIAAALNVRPHTAHDFCRRLFRHFDVSGRGELLTKPDCRQLIFRPALSPAYYAHDRANVDGVFPEPSIPPADSSD